MISDGLYVTTRTLRYKNSERTCDDSASVSAIAIVAQENIAVDCEHKNCLGSFMISLERKQICRCSRTIATAVVNIGSIVTVAVARPCGVERKTRKDTARSAHTKFDCNAGTLVAYSGAG